MLSRMGPGPGRRRSCPPGQSRAPRFTPAGLVGRIIGPDRRPAVSRFGARLVGVLFLMIAVPLSAETLPELFQRAKAQVKNQSWREALTTLDQLDAESARPGNEAARQQ